jgi:hypothetical protein
MIQNIEEVVFKFFWGGYWGLWENQGGGPLLLFYYIIMIKFFEVFEGDAWGAPLPLRASLIQKWWRQNFFKSSKFLHFFLRLGREYFQVSYPPTLIMICL